VADAPARQIPQFAAPLANDSDQAKEVVESRHAEYESHHGSWEILLDAFEGDGGFLDGEYIWPFPREDADNFEERQQMARYHNYLESLVDLYVRFMFTQGVSRESKSDDLNAWLEDTDGHGQTMTDLMKRFLALALVSGHAGTLVDKTADEPSGPTKAEEKGRVVASVFTALAIADWRTKRGVLQAVKLIESAEPVGIAEPAPEDDDAIQYLLWDAEGWARFDAKGKLIDGGTPGLGAVPFVVLRPKPSHRSDMLGRPLISNANVVRAHFNRCSEEDQVLRDNAFSVLTVSVPSDGNVDQAKTDLGNRIGSARALVVKGTIDYATPDQQVPASIRENSAYLVREMYRAAHIRFQRDGLSAESGDSIRLQYTELNEMLQGLGGALAASERAIARHFFAWQSPDEATAQQAFEDAAFEVTYPDEFFLDDLMTDLEAWAEAIRMDLGPTMNARIKRKAVRRIDRDIPIKELDKIDKEIDELPNNEVEVVPPDMGDPDKPLPTGTALG
jgi:hypothetical protein